MNERVNQIQARLAEINTELETATGDALTALVTESNSLLEELRGIQGEVQTRQQIRDAIAAGAGAPVPGTPNAGNQTAEQRAAAQFVRTREMSIDVEQTRSMLVSSGHLATPTQVAGINDIPGAQVSSIIDMINVVNCEGMGEYEGAYVKANADAAGDQVEGAAAQEQNLGDYGFVRIKPTSHSVIGYISKQARKQTPLLYANKTRSQSLLALRKKAAKICSIALKASELVDTVNAKVSGGKALVDETTLRKLTMSYGDDESVVGGAVLQLNKADLLAFGDVRGANEKKAVYEITANPANPNTGTIKDGGLTVPYVLNSNLTTCSGTAQTATAQPTMFYGNLQNLTLRLFSPYEVTVSTEFAFNKRMDTILGEVGMGAGVVAQGGFVALVIPAQA